MILSLWLSFKTSAVHCLIDIIKATVHLVVHESLLLFGHIAVLHRCGLLLKMVLLYVIIFIFLFCFLVNILDVWFLSLCLSVTVVSPAKTSEPIEMQFGILSRASPGNHVFHEVHIGATWRIRLNGPCVAAMQPYVKLL